MRALAGAWGVLFISFAYPFPSSSGPPWAAKSFGRGAPKPAWVRSDRTKMRTMSVSES